MKPVENVFLRRARDWGTGVPNCQHNVIVLFECSNSNEAFGSIVFLRVLQEILDDKRGVSFFTGDI